MSKIDFITCALPFVSVKIIENLDTKCCVIIFQNDANMTASVYYGDGAISRAELEKAAVMDYLKRSSNE